MKWLLFLAMATLTVASFWAPPAKSFMDPELARIIFFHLPCAFGCTVFLFAGAWLSFKYLSKREIEWDIKAAAANEMGFMLALVTMASGILFSRVQWNAWWNWDPRQTSFLFVLLLYGAYFALRGAYTDEVKRAGVSAAYAVINVLPSLFLIFVLPRLMQSLHPNTTVLDTLRPGVTNTGFDRSYWMIILGVFIMLMITCVWLYRLNVRVGLMELKKKNGELEISSGNPALTGVVRPVSVPEES